MIASAYDEADRRDPQRNRQRVFLVDGNKQQIAAIQARAAFVASVIAIGQALRGLARKIALFPRRRVEQQLGHALMPVITALATGKGTQR